MGVCEFLEVLGIVNNNHRIKIMNLDWHTLRNSSFLNNLVYPQSKISFFFNDRDKRKFSNYYLLITQKSLSKVISIFPSYQTNAFTLSHFLINARPSKYLQLISNSIFRSWFLLPLLFLLKHFRNKKIHQVTNYFI